MANSLTAKALNLQKFNRLYIVLQLRIVKPVQPLLGCFIVMHLDNILVCTEARTVTACVIRQVQENTSISNDENQRETFHYDKVFNCSILVSHILHR